MFSDAITCANVIFKVLMLIASNMIQQKWFSSPIEKFHQVQSIANKWKIGFCKCNQHVALKTDHIGSETRLEAIGALLFCTPRALQHQACVFNA
jgi:hypothetical protein